MKILKPSAQNFRPFSKLKLITGDREMRNKKHKLGLDSQVGWGTLGY